MTASEAKIVVTGHDEIRIHVREPQTDRVRIDYHTLVGNNPNENGHQICYWKNRGELTFTIPPEKSFTIDNKLSEDMVTYDLSLSGGSHVFAYTTVPYKLEDYTARKSGFCAADDEKCSRQKL